MVLFPRLVLIRCIWMRPGGRPTGEISDLIHQNFMLANWLTLQTLISIVADV